MTRPSAAAPGTTFVPEAFAVDAPRAAAFMRDWPFALLASADLSLTHLPLLAVDGELRGHMARANPHWQALEGSAGTPCTAVFSGPHAYISPAWYASHEAVPTWNYTAVHVRGRAFVHHAEDWIDTELQRLVERFEQQAPERITAALQARLVQHVVGIRIEVDSVTAKFKLSQNRPAEDQALVAAALAQQADPYAQALADFMRRELDLP